MWTVGPDAEAEAGVASGSRAHAAVNANFTGSPFPARDVNPKRRWPARTSLRALLSITVQAARARPCSTSPTLNRAWRSPQRFPLSACSSPPLDHTLDTVLVGQFDRVQTSTARPPWP
jgi:hypothetical protein